MSNLYLVMNDYNENERFFKGVFDIKKTYPVKESKYDFPYYIEDENCPDDIFLNLEEDKEISFDYRKEQGHIFSSNLWEIISKFRMPEKYIKNYPSLAVVRVLLRIRDINMYFSRLMTSLITKNLFYWMLLVVH